MRQKLAVFARICNVCLVVSLVGVSEAKTQDGNSDNYYLALYDFFSYIPAFPIVFPQGEKAGDVYKELGVYYGRKDECFREARTSRSETFLTRTIRVNRSNLAGSVDVERELIGGAVAQAGIKLQEASTVSFGDNGKTTVEQLSPSTIETLLNQPANNACRQGLLQKLRSTASDISGVPLILQSVIYATVNISSETQQLVDAGSQAKLDNALSPLKASGQINVQRVGNSIVIANTGKTTFPIAWRPAFISTTHYNYINELRRRPWYDYLLVQIGLKKSDQQILQLLRNEFKLDLKEIPTSRNIRSQMASGAAMKFDEDNKEHLQYLRDVDILYGLSEAIFHDRKS